MLHNYFSFHNIAFVTAMLGLGAFSASAANTYTPQSGSDAGNTYDVNYEIGVTFNIEQGDAGICFASPDDNNFVLIQFKAGENMLRPHSRVDNNWQGVHDVRFEQGFTLETDKDYNARIIVCDNYQKAAVLLSAENMPEFEAYLLAHGDYHLDKGSLGARLGLRQNFGNGVADKAYLDNFYIKDGDGNTVFSEDFSDASACCFSLDEHYRIVDGRLYACGVLDAPEVYSWQIEKADDENNFTFECDFEVQSIAAGIIFNARDNDNFNMWQFNFENSTPRFRPHVWTNGGAACLSEIDYAPLQIGKEHHLRVEVSDGGRKATTFIDGEKIGETTGVFSPNTLVGIRASWVGETPEAAYYDNFKVTGHDGRVIFSEDFSSGMAYFSEGRIIDGRLYIAGVPGEGEKRVYQTETPNDLEFMTTAIDDIMRDNGAELLNVYNLQGIQVLKNADPVNGLSTLPAGLYIVNGKKTIVK